LDSSFHFYFASLSLCPPFFSCVCPPVLILLDSAIGFRFFFFSSAVANPKLNNMHLFIHAFLQALMRLRIVRDNKHGLVEHRLLAKPRKAVYCRSEPTNCTRSEYTITPLKAMPKHRKLYFSSCLKCPLFDNDVGLASWHFGFI